MHNKPLNIQIRIYFLHKNYILCHNIKIGVFKKDTDKNMNLKKKLFVLIASKFLQCQLWLCEIFMPEWNKIINNMLFLLLFICLQEPSCKQCVHFLIQHLSETLSSGVQVFKNLSACSRFKSPPNKKKEQKKESQHYHVFNIDY